MVEEAKMTRLDMLDVHCKAERVMSDYRHLGELVAQMCQASDGDGDPNELSRLIELIGHKHAECSTDLKAIRRLIK